MYQQCANQVAGFQVERTARVGSCQASGLVLALSFWTIAEINHRKRESWGSRMDNLDRLSGGYVECRAPNFMTFHDLNQAALQYQHIQWAVLVDGKGLV